MKKPTRREQSRFKFWPWYQRKERERKESSYAWLADVPRIVPFMSYPDLLDPDFTPVVPLAVCPLSDLLDDCDTASPENPR